jgi:hypothetical protein
MKYHYSVVEECIMNTHFEGYRGGRVEVREKDKPYAVEEIRFMLPESLMEGFREWIDGKESDLPILLRGEELYSSFCKEMRDAKSNFRV